MGAGILMGVRGEGQVQEVAAGVGDLEKGVQLPGHQPELEKRSLGPGR